ncbi:hypothetical protein SERLA73DRAFT_70471 [Serpula lacrymans var. lacrymans S7.3]|uniref:Uncharacterized protein n=2 Tax=Serpula lacrymans var. lacrymans TaxID=341189 RepID=F8PN16_SERL3|nr:uncharacterized protein SERLADRAFT_434593 [Serpula lacrymans var. lacrymans S7.9]EGO02998.1 hypothetical protein SERLA73DRAFT_70471 [Serpula lacrymans var. lacrymans S7.3]EGO28678.1 hypothetical protein SERLADRAFT_434593 [Serpula lacrymans var. lacrymans S7.9]
MSADISPTVDLQKSSVDIARRLSCLQYFLSAAGELLTCSRLALSEFKRHGKKIIALMEIARTTLTRAGLKLHLFTSCSASFLPYKSVYFKLLLLLRFKRNNFTADLQGRLKRLLLPLSTRLVIRCKIDPYSQLGLDESLIKAGSCPSQRQWTLPGSSGTTSTARKHEVPDKVMLPPDAFPVDSEQGDSRNRTSTKFLYGTSTARSRPVHRQHPNRETKLWDSGTENSPPAVRSGPFPGRRNFGIFCGGRKTGFQSRGQIRFSSAKVTGRD